MKYYFFVIRWLWHNRGWKASRQKWKALDRDWELYRERGVKSWML